MESLTLEHLPPTIAVHLALYKDVSNAAALHAQLLARNPEFEYAFIDASVIVSRRQVLAAAYKAANALVNGNLSTPNVHSEVVVSLNPSNNIAESYRRYGLTPSSTTLLAVKITHPALPLTADQISTHLSANVDATPLAPSDENIASLTDWAKVRKYYKLNGLAWLDKLPEETRRRESEVLVLGGMALRGV